MRKADNLTTVILKSGKLKFLEPSGPLRACNGTVLTLHLLHLGRSEKRLRDEVTADETPHAIHIPWYRLSFFFLILYSRSSL